MQRMKQRYDDQLPALPELAEGQLGKRIARICTALYSVAATMAKAHSRSHPVRNAVKNASGKGKVPLRMGRTRGRRYAQPYQARCARCMNQRRGTPLPWEPGRAGSGLGNLQQTDPALSLCSNGHGAGRACATRTGINPCFLPRLHFQKAVRM
jgi:hypothetical protein